ncbi:UDP-GalNAc:beta-1,3-N-acetylgalactosaminyltransferase 1-like [Saccoglossus kowalevskii]|uniref:Hexosyltransferase n=1 Tax=Saccoglossus kowalevskii TaxID=10224 RepID=A0ABM0M436_SACKO|nr:PREDICTED: lactosylceramide 1,3-N-acetyl-beta-D-glucosaminyltransferase-like [Saccoglossus kowalevskii]
MAKRRHLRGNRTAGNLFLSVVLVTFVAWFGFTVYYIDTTPPPHQQRDDRDHHTFVLYSRDVNKTTEALEHDAQAITRPQEKQSGYTMKFLLNNRNLCRNHDGSQSDVELLIVISSRQKNVLNRRFIRRYWANLRNYSKVLARKVVTVFLFGVTPDSYRKLYIENDKFGDVLMADFLDTYNNLTLKTIMGIQWATQYCPSARFVMKSDDDVLIQPLNALRHLRTQSESDLMIGRCGRTSRPVRETKSPNYVSYEEWSDHTFPPYCSGSSYIMSSDLVRKLSSLSKVETSFKFEDVYIGILLQKLGIDPLNHPAFAPEYINLNSACDIRHLIASHHAWTRYMYDGITNIDYTLSSIKELWVKLIQIRKGKISCPPDTDGFGHKIDASFQFDEMLEEEFGSNLTNSL